MISDLATTAMQILNNQRDLLSSLQRSLQAVVSSSFAISSPSAVFSPSLSAVSASSSAIYSPSEDPKSSNNLAAIAHRIINCEERGVELDFEMAISLIRFILKLEFLQETGGEEYAIQVIRQEVDRTGIFTVPQAKRWRDWGYRLTRLAGAGE